MRLALPLLLGLTSISAAQGSTATAEILVGCTAAAPVDSLLASPTTPHVFVPDADGMVVMEIESAGAPGAWVFETVQTGFSGDGYLRWNGPNLFNTSGVDVIPLTFQIETAGDHVMRLWSQQNHPDTSEENDCWVRVDGGQWHKLFGFQNNIWNPNAVIEGPNDILQVSLGAGLHVLEFSGRSANFKIDRADVIPTSIWWANPNRLESDVLRSRPLIGSLFHMEVGDPTGSQGFSAGSLALLALGQPDGSCGALLPAYGELFVSLPALVDPFPVSWDVPGRSATFTATVPNDTSLIGASLMWQGAIAEPGRVVLTDGLLVTLGDV